MSAPEIEDDEELCPVCEMPIEECECSADDDDGEDGEIND
jgi:hypothetical protein